MAPLDLRIGCAAGIFECHQLIAYVTGQVGWISRRERKDVALRSDQRPNRDKIRFVPVHVIAQQFIAEYLALAGHGEDAAGPLFRLKTTLPANQTVAQSQLGLPQYCPEIWARNWH